MNRVEAAAQRQMPEKTSDHIRPLEFASALNPILCPAAVVGAFIGGYTAVHAVCTFFGGEDTTSDPVHATKLGDLPVDKLVDRRQEIENR